MVECAGFENRSARKGSGSSNLPLSVGKPTTPVTRVSWVLYIQGSTTCAPRCPQTAPITLVRPCRWTRPRHFTISREFNGRVNRFSHNAATAVVVAKAAEKRLSERVQIKPAFRCPPQGADGSTAFAIRSSRSLRPLRGAVWPHSHALRGRRDRPEQALHAETQGQRGTFQGLRQ